MHILACKYTHSHCHIVKRNLAHGQVFSATDWSRVREQSPAKQDSYKVKHGRPRYVCQDLKALSPKLCLVLFTAAAEEYTEDLSLSLTWLPSDSWFNSYVLKEIMCLIGLLGAFFKWVLSHPHSPRLLPWKGCPVRCQNPHSAGWARNRNLESSWVAVLLLLSQSSYNKCDNNSCH